jgi:hypothetical protein
MTRQSKAGAPSPDAPSSEGQAMVLVRLTCILSGDGESWPSGTQVELPADEAERLIGLGAAVAAASAG